MTTTTDLEAVAIAKGLSAGEQAALRYFETHESYLIADEDEPLNDFDRLFLKRLLQKKYLDMAGVLGKSRYFLTPFGSRVLASLEAAQAVAPGKATSITAAEFVEQGYKKLIDEGKCIVTHKFPTETFKVWNVFEIPLHKHDSGSKLWVEYADIPDDPCNILSTEELTVTWLPTARPTPASASGIEKHREE